MYSNDNSDVALLNLNTLVSVFATSFLLIRLPLKDWPREPFTDKADLS